MENIEKFVSLINGELGEDAERNLFSELAVNDELRADYKCFSAVTGSINSNLDTFAPSSALKAGIYAKAGIALPAVESAVQVVPATKSAFYQTGLFKNIVTGASTLIATIIVMLLFFQPKDSVNQVKYSDNSSTIKTDIPITKNFETEKPATPINPKPIVKYVYIGREIQSRSKEILSVPPIQNDSENNKFLSLTEPIAKKEIVLYRTNSENATRLIQNSLPGKFDFMSPINNQIYGVNFEVKSSSNWNIPKETINPTEFNKLNNMSLDLLYKISDDFKIGAGVRQETFYTVYTGEEANGSVFRYMQQPNLTTFSLIGKYYPFDFMSIKTYGQLNLGLNVAGWVAKPIIGIEYFPVDNFSVLLAFEYSYFNYKHQNNSFSSSKAGLNYGLSFHF